MTLQKLRILPEELRLFETIEDFPRLESQTTAERRVRNEFLNFFTQVFWVTRRDVSVAIHPLRENIRHDADGRCDHRKSERHGFERRSRTPLARGIHDKYFRGLHGAVDIDLILEPSRKRDAIGNPESRGKFGKMIALRTVTNEKKSRFGQERNRAQHVPEAFICNEPTATHDVMALFDADIRRERQSIEIEGRDDEKLLDVSSPFFEKIGRTPAHATNRPSPLRIVREKEVRENSPEEFRDGSGLRVSHDVMDLENIRHVTYAREPLRADAVIERRILMDGYHAVSMFPRELLPFFDNPPWLIPEPMRSRVEENVFKRRRPFSLWEKVRMRGLALRTYDINPPPVLPKLLEHVPKGPLLALENAAVATDHEQVHIDRSIHSDMLIA